MAAKLKPKVAALELEVDDGLAVTDAPPAALVPDGIPEEVDVESEELPARVALATAGLVLLLAQEVTLGASGQSS